MPGPLNNVTASSGCASGESRTRATSTTGRAGSGEQQPGQVLLFVVGTVHRQPAVVELEAQDRLVQPCDEFLAHCMHAPERVGGVGASEQDACARDGVDGLGRGERETQP
ncbi:hypothetical protein [Streptomyces liliifuscus]|uniref:Uncharacterized protein n=1 Tax=Streptomyces liliifuscus TaxID=2797636 RepID=A0A7T7L4M3_9ACTN|nr:hypothetical protein [Streptomyces liliifuscus]QQM46355.1 hypothetical protein JEQ17_47815 [Streptomyces liliifuscus]